MSRGRGGRSRSALPSMVVSRIANVYGRGVAAWRFAACVGRRRVCADKCFLRCYELLIHRQLGGIFIFLFVLECLLLR